MVEKLRNFLHSNSLWSQGHLVESEKCARHEEMLFASLSSPTAWHLLDFLWFSCCSQA